MNKKTIGNKTKGTTKIIELFLLIMLLLISMSGCGKASESSETPESPELSELPEPSGKYYSETFDGAYFEFDGKSTCY